MTEMPSARKPTVVLVHGAFAESASWNGVISGCWTPDTRSWR